jgi:tetratricopeptide (TPR) repeat protein
MFRIFAVLLACIAPALAPVLAAGPPAERTRAELDRLLTALAAAPTEAVAAGLEAQIQHMWLNMGSPAVGLLMARGIREANVGQQAEAEADFAAAITLDPSDVEAWHQRALARFEQGDTRGAIRDLEEVLKREPRHFAALDTLAEIAEQQQDWKGAYAAWLKKMEIDPKTPDGEDRLKDLQRRAFGDET